MRGDDELRRGLAALASDVDESGAWDKVQRRAGRMRRRRRGMQAASALLVILLAVGGVLALREVLRPEPRLVIVGADSEDSAATQTTAAAEVEAPTADALLSRAISWVEEGSVRAQVSGGGADPQVRSYGAGGLPLRLDSSGGHPFGPSPIVYDGSAYRFRAPSSSPPADLGQTSASSSGPDEVWASVDQQNVAQDPNDFDGMFSWFWLFDPLLALRSMVVSGEVERLDTGDGWRIRGHVDRELLAEACPLPLSESMLSQADGWPVEVDVGDDPRQPLRRTVVTVFPESPEEFVLRWDWTPVDVIEFDDPASLVAGPPILPLPLLADLARVRLESYRIEGNLAKGRYPLRVLSPVADASLIEQLLRAYSQVEPPVRSAVLPNDLALRVTLVSLDGGEVEVHLQDEGDWVWWISSVPPVRGGDPARPDEEAGEQLTARAPQLATLVRELAVRNEEGPFPPLPDTRPADFGVVLAYGVTARNVLDTFAGTFTKDLISPDTPTATAVLNLTEDDLDRIYSQLRIDLSGYARIYRPDTGGVLKEPHDSYYLRVRAAGRDKEVFWADEGDSALPDAVRLRNTFEVIRSIIEQKPEVQDLPPVQGGYE
jgi:hypothetical protein